MNPDGTSWIIIAAVSLPWADNCGAGFMPGNIGGQEYTSVPTQAGETKLRPQKIMG
jgi:hypothetical protein